MPTAVLKSYAKQSGESLAHAEKVWNETKAEVRKNYPDVSDDRYWALVSAITKKKLGIKESMFESIHLCLTRSNG